MQFEIAKFPLLEQKIKELETKKRLIDLLNIRKSMLLDNSISLKPYEYNEKEILAIETDQLLAKTHAQVQQDEIQVQSMIKYFTETLAEMDNGGYELMIENGQRRGKKDETLLKFMTEYDMSEFDTDLSKKLHYYISIRNYIKPGKQEKPNKPMQVVK